MFSGGKDIQVFYEIAMSIGGSLESEEMAKNALIAYIRKLDCCSGIILKSQNLVDGQGRKVSFVFSVPKIDDEQTLFKDALEQSHEFMTQPSHEAGKPLIRRNPESLFSHTMILPGYGFIVLHKKDIPLEPEVISSLAPLNCKLASSCLACENKQSLVESESKYRRIFESIQDVYAEIEFETGKIIEISPSAISILGYTREELLGFNSRSLYVNDNERTKLREYLLADGFTNDFEITVWTKAKKQKTVSFSVRVERNPTDGKLRVVGTMRDIGPRKRAEEALLQTRRWLEEEVQQRTAKLYETNESLKAEIEERIEAERILKKTQTKLIQSEKLAGIGQLASGIAHEINTPIQYIGSHIRFLEGGYSTLIKLGEKLEEILVLMEASGLEKTAKELKLELKAIDFEYLKQSLPESLQHAAEGVEQITSIVRGMNLFAHTGSHQKTHNSINEIILNVLKISQGEWRDNIEIESVLEENLPEVLCVRHSIGQVILNLLLNAVHAIEERQESQVKGSGLIRIETMVIDQDIVIRIRDNGIGIPRKTINRIFEPFFTTKAPDKGTGQGLAIVNSIIVSEHGGSIDVKSQPGEGTEFEVRFPIESPNLS